MRASRRTVAPTLLLLLGAVALVSGPSGAKAQPVVDLSLAATITPPGPFAPGDVAQLQVTVTNQGRRTLRPWSPSSRRRIRSSTTNSSRWCPVSRIRARCSTTISLRRRVRVNRAFLSRKSLPGKSDLPTRSFARSDSTFRRAPPEASTSTSPSSTAKSELRIPIPRTTVQASCCSSALRNRRQYPFRQRESLPSCCSFPLFA